MYDQFPVEFASKVLITEAYLGICALHLYLGFE